MCTETDNPVIQTQLITVQSSSMIPSAWWCWGGWGGNSRLCQGRTSGLPSHSAASRSTSPWREGERRDKGGEEQRLRRRPSVQRHRVTQKAADEGRLPAARCLPDGAGAPICPFNRCRLNSNDLPAHYSYRMPHPPARPPTPLHHSANLRRCRTPPAARLKILRMCRRLVAAIATQQMSVWLSPSPSLSLTVWKCQVVMLE